MNNKLIIGMVLLFIVSLTGVYAVPYNISTYNAWNGTTILPFSASFYTNNTDISIQNTSGSSIPYIQYVDLDGTLQYVEPSGTSGNDVYSTQTFVGGVNYTIAFYLNRGSTFDTTDTCSILSLYGLNGSEYFRFQELYRNKFYNSAGLFASNTVSGTTNFVGTDDFATFVYNSTHINVYSNGVFLKSLTPNSAITSFLLNTTLYLKINPIASNCVGVGQTLNATYDDISIYNRALSDAEITQLYGDRDSITDGRVYYEDFSPTLQQTFATTTGKIVFNSSLNDYSGNGHTLTNSGATYTALGVKGNAYGFDGISSKMTFPTNNSYLNISGGNITVSLWINTNNTDSSAKIFMTGNTSATNSYWGLRLATNGIQFEMRASNESGVSSSTLYTTTNNNWYHIVAVREDTNNYLYVNGNYVGSYNNSAQKTFLSNIVTLNALTRSTTSSYLRGLTDEVMLFNRSLSSTEVLALYNNQSINQSGLVAYYPFDEISTNNTYPFSNLSDKSGNGNTAINTGSATWVGSYITGIGDYTFDGTSKYLTINSNIINTTIKETNQYTICTVFSSFNTSVTQAIFSHRNASNSTIAFGLQGSQVRTSITNSTGTQIGSSSGTLNSNQQYHVCAIYKNPYEELWVNATNMTGETVSGLTSAGFGTFIGTRSSPSNYLNGTILNLQIFNRSLNSTEITALYNNQTILSGLIAYYDFDNEPSQQDFINLESDTYFNKTQQNVLFSSSLNTSMYQSQVQFVPREILTNNTLSGNVTISGMGYAATGSSAMVWNLSAGTYNVTVAVAGYYNKTFTDISFSELASSTYYLDGLYNTVLNITARNKKTAALLNTFTVNDTYLTSSVIGSTTNGSYVFYTIVGNHSILVMPDGFTDNTTSVIVTSPTYNYTSYSWASNSIDINIYNVTSGALLNTTTVIIETDGPIFLTNTTATGSIFITNLTEGTYNISFTASNLVPTNYLVTVGNNSYQSLNAYMSDNTANTVVFTAIDVVNSLAMENVQADVYKKINGSYVLIKSTYTDVSGKFSLTYETGANYRFVLTSYSTNPTYAVKTFTLNPILFSTYTIRIERDVDVTTDDSYKGIALNLNPSEYKNNFTNQFEMVISAPDGNLEYYNYSINVTNDPIIYEGSGNVANGETLTRPLYIVNATTSTQVIVNYGYMLTTGEFHSFRKIYDVSNTTAERYTLDKIQDNRYGLPLLDRVIVTLSVIFIVVGLAISFGLGEIGAYLGTMLILGVVTNIGFLSAWLTVPTIGIIVCFLIWGQR